MRTRRFSRAILGVLASLSFSLPAVAGLLPGCGELSGTVSGPTKGVLPIVYAHNTLTNVRYAVYVVNGKYRAVDLIPGPYEVTLRPAVDQLEGFTAQTVKVVVAAVAHVKANFTLENIHPVPNDVGGYPYEGCSRDVPDCGARILPYDKIYPAGPARRRGEQRRP